LRGRSRFESAIVLYVSCENVDTMSKKLIALVAIVIVALAYLYRE
jgi:hypothetical protein